MRLLVFAAALLLPAIASAAPFCVVDNYGNEDCGYYSMASCRDSARFKGGACVYKPDSASTPVPWDGKSITNPNNPYDFGGAIMRGSEAGKQARRQRELHDLEIAQRQATIARTQAEAAALSAPATSSVDANRQKWVSDCQFLYDYTKTLKDRGDDVRGRAVWADFKDCRTKYEERWPDGKGELGSD